MKAERKMWASAHGIRACKPLMGEHDVYLSSTADANRWLRPGTRVYVVADAPPWLNAAPWLSSFIEYV